MPAVRTGAWMARGGAIMDKGSSKNSVEIAKPYNRVRIIAAAVALVVVIVVLGSRAASW